MKVRDVMTQDVFYVDQNESLLKAAQIMRDANIGSVPVKSGQQTVGIITDRDITLRAVADKQQNSTCGEVMSKEIVICTPDMDVQEASTIMAAHQIRRLPVVENGNLVGMVALGDIATSSHLQNEAENALRTISTPSMPDLQ